MRRVICLVMVLSLVLVLSGCKGGGGSSAGGAATTVAGLTSDFLNEDPLGDLPGDDGGDDPVIPGDIPGVGDPDPSMPDPSMDDPHVNPEPSTLIMFMMSILGFFGYRMKMKKVRS